MKMPKPLGDLAQFLSAPAEKANEDLIIGFFRDIFGNKFTRQKEAAKSDGYVAGNLVLELKSNSEDWLAGLCQGIAYSKELDFSKVVVAAHEFLAIWFISDIPQEITDEIVNASGAPNTIGKQMAKKLKSRNKELLNLAAYNLDATYLPTKGSLFSRDPSIYITNIEQCKELLKSGNRKRQRITLRNFASILKLMRSFFEDAQPLLVVRAFYSIIFSWDENSKVQISQKKPDCASVGGDIVSGLKPDLRDAFKQFVENHYVSDDRTPSKDVFFAHFDEALDAVDRDFRIKHGIFFTDLDLSRFAMWYVKRMLGDIGANYLVIDPACGSGNLVTNWRSPLELRHKVVSEIEPELLFAVERRMKGDEWHNGKFTVVPKVSESRGLNFLENSAEDYLNILKDYLREKGIKPNKPIAFLCNPPYRSDDDQGAQSISYGIHDSIIALTGKDGSAERYCCFLAQMKMICEQAMSSGLPEESLLLLFTQGSWLTDRPVYKQIRSEIFGRFEDVGGFIVNSKEFFDVRGSFPIAFTIWRFKSNNANLDANRPIFIRDLTWLKKGLLSAISWDSAEIYNKECSNILDEKRSVTISFGQPRKNIREWTGEKRKDMQRERRKSEVDSDPCGLPIGDHRHARKKRLGESDGIGVGFCDDLTPFRIRQKQAIGPWFRLDVPFMDCRRNRCLSGAPDQKGFCASNGDIAKKLFTWFALGRTFASEGYPIWVNQMEMWGIDLTNEIIKISYSIGFAENECVETRFPANNPINGVQEIFVSNPMSPNSKSSFWSTVMRPMFDEGSSPVDELVKAVLALYKKWKSHLADRPEIQVTYERSYFIGRGKLTANSGIVQIRDYAKEKNIKELNEALDVIQAKLGAVKNLFREILMDSGKINYFGQTNKENANLSTKHDDKKLVKTNFQRTLDLRLACSARIIDKLRDDPNLGRTKFVKTLYLAEQVSGIELDTNYYREAAGPLDQRAIYNEKFGIEVLAASQGLFTPQKMKFKNMSEDERDFVKYTPGGNLKSASKGFVKLVNNSVKVDEFNRVIELMLPMTVEQAEIVATLYAAWNDLLLKNRGKSVPDAKIINEVRNNWHESKKRFKEDQLAKAIKWMKEHDLIPKGKGKPTKVRVSIDF